MAINFPFRARRGDPNGHMVVQQLLEFLRDEVEKLGGTFAIGNATITNPATSVVVVHGLDTSTYSVVITPLSDPVNRYWVSNKTATQFQINVSATPAVSLAFNWLVKGAS